MPLEARGKATNLIITSMLSIYFKKGLDGDIPYSAILIFVYFCFYAYFRLVRLDKG